MARFARMAVVAALAVFAKANESAESFKPAELLHEKQDEKAAKVTLERLQDEMIHLSGRLDRDQAVSNQMMESLEYDEVSKSAGTVSLFETLKRPEYIKIKKEVAEENTEVTTLMQKTRRQVQEDATQVEDKMEVVRAKEPHFAEIPEAEPDTTYPIMLGSPSGGSTKGTSFGDHPLSKMISAERKESASLNRIKAEMHSMTAQEQLSKKTGAEIASELKSLEQMRDTEFNTESTTSLAEFVSSPRSLGLLVAVAGCSVTIALVAGIEAMWQRRSTRNVELTVPLVHV